MDSDSKYYAGKALAKESVAHVPFSRVQSVSVGQLSKIKLSHTKIGVSKIRAFIIIIMYSNREG